MSVVRIGFASASFVAMVSCAVHAPAPLADTQLGSAMHTPFAAHAEPAFLSPAYGLAQGNAQMRPLPTERLAKEIQLPNCPGVRIIEWRTTPGYDAVSGPTERAVQVVDHVCATAQRVFYLFFDPSGLRLASRNFTQDLCFMPALEDRAGYDFRNLNDVSWRFRNRYFVHRGLGGAPPVWGYHHRSSKTVYMRNDVFNDDGTENDRFKTVLAHEIFHALSYEYGIYGQRHGDRDTADEVMARKFTVFLGLGE